MTEKPSGLQRLPKIPAAIITIARSSIQSTPPYPAKILQRRRRGEEIYRIPRKIMEFLKAEKPEMF